MQPTKVKQVALERGLFVSDNVDDLSAFAGEVDLGVVVAFGRIIKADLLEKIPMVNMHFSLLPRWRGAAPVERAMLSGDKKTGVSLMAVEVGLDTGGVFAVREVVIDDTVRVTELRLALTQLGIELLLDKLGHPADISKSGDVLHGFEAYFQDPVPQSGEVTYAAKITPEDLKIDWSQPSEMALRRIRVGKAWTAFRGVRLIIHDAVSAEQFPDTAAAIGCMTNDGLVRTGDGCIKLLRVQSAGKGAMDFSSWVKGVHLGEGERLGDNDNN